jgi:capsid protein
MAWRAGSESINSLMLQGGELQRARARQLVRSNPYAAIAAASFTAHLVGCGIKPSSLVEDAALKDRIQRLWLAWTDEADADGLTDFCGLQAMAARAMFEAGECFFRFRLRRPGDGLSVPLQLQMLSAEHLPLDKFETLANGHEIVFGIEFDRKKVAAMFAGFVTRPAAMTSWARTVRPRTRMAPRSSVCSPAPCISSSIRSFAWCPRAASEAHRGSLISGVSMSATRIFSPRYRIVSPSMTQFCWNARTQSVKWA